MINKAAGILTVPDRYDPSIPSLDKILNDRFGKVFTAHRLDKDTSGIMVYGMNAETHKYLSGLFQENKIEKIYHLIISGNLADDEVEIDIPIMANPAKKGTSIPSVRGKESLTKLKVIERFRHSTYVKCKLITGRHHQIRVHTSAVGHPLLVDNIYGQNNEFFVSSVKRRFKLKKNSSEEPIIARLTMHAFSLEFIHPSSNTKVYFEAPYPKDFKAALQVLRKYSAIPDFKY